MLWCVLCVPKDTFNIKKIKYIKKNRRKEEERKSFVLFVCFGALFVGMCVREFTSIHKYVLQTIKFLLDKCFLVAYKVLDIYYIKKSSINGNLVRDTNNKSLSNSNSVRSCGTRLQIFIINNQASLVSIANTQNAHTHNKIKRESKGER